MAVKDAYKVHIISLPKVVGILWQERIWISGGCFLAGLGLDVCVCVCVCVKSAWRRVQGVPREASSFTKMQHTFPSIAGYIRTKGLATGIQAILT